MTNNSATKLFRQPYSATNGLRDPDWRWQLAMAYLPVTPTTSLPDATCWHLVDYLQGGDGKTAKVSLDRSFSLQPLLAIHNLRIKRLSLEARILAYRDISLAAKASQIPAQIAQDYCDVFFDVQSRLHASRAIDSKIINAVSERGDSVRRELYGQAYFGGPHVAEHWIERLPLLGTCDQHDLDTPDGIELERLELAITSQTLASEIYDPTLHVVHERLLTRQPRSRTYAHCVADYLTDVLVTTWQRKPTAVAQEIVEMRAAA